MDFCNAIFRGVSFRCADFCRLFCAAVFGNKIRPAATRPVTRPATSLAITRPATRPTIRLTIRPAATRQATTRPATIFGALFLSLILAAAAPAFAPAAPAAPLKIATFNAENLFDATAQGSEYRDFTPPKCPVIFGAGECKVRRARWLADDKARYERRLREVAGVLRGIGADVVALQEIENEGVLRELAARAGYEFWHFAGGRGAPVGLGFVARVPLQNARATAVAGVKTRPVLRVDVAAAGGALTLINVHLPAFSNGAKKRNAAAQTTLAVARAAGSNSNLAGAGGGSDFGGGWLDFGWIFGGDDDGENGWKNGGESGANSNLAGSGGDNFAGGTGGKNNNGGAKNPAQTPASVIILGDFNSRYVPRKFSGKKDDFLFLPQVQSGEFFSLWEDARAPYHARTKGSHKNGKIDNALLSRAAAARYVRGSFAVVENAASDHAALVFSVR